MASGNRNKGQVLGRKEKEREEGKRTLFPPAAAREEEGKGEGGGVGPVCPVESSVRKSCCREWTVVSARVP